MENPKPNQTNEKKNTQEKKINHHLEKKSIKHSKGSIQAHLPDQTR